ncbi:Uncharacterised protein r2_g554 [Pycnogonum litorale]
MIENDSVLLRFSERKFIRSQFYNLTSVKFEVASKFCFGTSDRSNKDLKNPSSEILFTGTDIFLNICIHPQSDFRRMHKNVREPNRKRCPCRSYPSVSIKVSCGKLAVRQ